jgi:hypothetical protein
MDAQMVGNLDLKSTFGGSLLEFLSYSHTVSIRMRVYIWWYMMICAGENITKNVAGTCEVLPLQLPKLGEC